MAFAALSQVITSHTPVSLLYSGNDDMRTPDSSYFIEMAGVL